MMMHPPLFREAAIQYVQATPSQKQMEVSPRAHHQGCLALFMQCPTVLPSVCQYM